MSPFMLHAEPNPSEKTAYDFSFESLDGAPMPLAQFKGKVLLVVNTASKCGFTPQYKGLEALYTKYRDNGLVVIGIPSDDFGHQEPGSSAEIKQFCSLNYGVTFPMSQKISVKGRSMAPIYKWLTEKQYNGFEDSKVTWNFQKYLINEEGRLVAMFGPKMMPDSPEIIAALEQ